MHVKDITGKKFGKLTALKLDRLEKSDSNKSVQYFWKFQCDCGNVITANRNNITRHRQVACGRCRTGTYRTEEDSIIYHIYCQYRACSKRRHREFSLDFETFSILVKSPCSVCGSAPSRVYKRHNHEYLYTGVDRVDNLVGYIKGNVRPCCKTCNYAKHSLSEEQFQKWIKDLVKFHTT